jgi:hypothetical protein
MSAFVVSNKHVNCILSAYARYQRRYERPEDQVTDEQLTEMGKTLLRENVRSVNYRYNERGRISSGYRFSMIPEDRSSALQAVKLLHSLDYQSSERPDYDKSEARKLNDKLLRAVTHDLPGYDEVEWSV